MADQDKKITELQLISAILSSQMFPLDNGIQTYRATIAQLKAFLAPIYIPPARQEFTATGAATYYKTRAFVVSNASATVGATYTHNSVTWTVLHTVATGSIVYMYGNGSPLASGTLTKSGGTGDTSIVFTEYRDPVHLEVEMVGAGGGGSSGITASNTGIVGGNGGNTTFGTTFLVANGGTGGFVVPTAIKGGPGGTASIAAPAYGRAMQGENGNAGALVNSNYGARPTSGSGGATPLAGRGATDQYLANGATITGAIANTGCGGAGGSSNATNVDCWSGSGGGAGGYVKAIVPNPSVSYGLSVGAKGAGGTAGGGGYAGGAGADGIVIVMAYFQ